VQFVVSAVCHADWPEDFHHQTVANKLSLDPHNPASYIPISNLTFVSKLVGRAVDARLIDHCNKYNLLPVYQSAYRSLYSTETAIARIYNDVVGMLDQGHIGVLMLINWSAAFDTEDHGVLYQVLNHRFGVTNQALDRIKDCLTDREWAVHHEATVSQAYTMLYGVPQGTVLGSKLFSQYAEDVTEILERCMQYHHISADGMQGLRHGKPADILQIVTQVENGINDIARWCASRRL
jgi:Reverse transcriptase (RNA-dependent DNA polymerase)